MRMRLYIDENAMKEARVTAMRAQGMEVTTVQEAGTRSQTDEQQLLYSTEQGLAIYSYNVGHFAALHAQFLAKGQHHTGIILAQQERYGIGEEVHRLMALMEAISAEEMKDRLE